MADTPTRGTFEGMHTCFHPDLREGLIPLPEDEAIHVARVLRMREGEPIRLVDGHGSEAQGILMSVSKRSATVRVEELVREGTRPAGLILVVAPTKHTDRFEWLLEKATELGVEEILPVWTERSERRVDKHERWRKVVIAATKQCQRLWMPRFHHACPLGQLFQEHQHLQSISGAVAHCMANLEGVPTRQSWTEWQQDKKRAWIAIGPEGDFSDNEVRQLCDANVEPVHLGHLRLRTETAGMAAVAQFD